MLYVSIGDGGCDYKDTSRCGALNTAARDTHVLLGKVLRITRSGGVPADNPWAATGGRCALTGSTDPGRHCQETFAWGLRNPFHRQAADTGHLAAASARVKRSAPVTSSVCPSWPSSPSTATATSARSSRATGAIRPSPADPRITPSAPTRKGT